MADAKKKVEVMADCKNGKHTFIVTGYMQKGTIKKATLMRCQHCLMAMNLEEVEMNEWKNEEGMS